MSGFIPDDIVVDILSRLPVKSILRFRCVCKSWCNLFSNPKFISMHHNHSVEKEKFSILLSAGKKLFSIDNYDSSSITSCEAIEINYPFRKKDDYGYGYGYDTSVVHDIHAVCNGLLCISPLHQVGKRVCLWNPATKEYKKMPLPNLRYPISCYCIGYGFCYDHKIEDYKLFRTTSCFTHNEYDRRIPKGFGIEIYTLGLDSWKTIPLIYPYEPCGKPVVVNGDLHWIVTPLKSRLRGSRVIVSFDMGDQRIKKVSSLEHMLANSCKTLEVALGGCLCVVESCKGFGINVWVMKEYGVKESWTKLHFITITLPSYIGRFNTVFKFFKNGEILLAIEMRNRNDAHDIKNVLALYDPKQGTAIPLQTHCEDRWTNATTYMESLVSLNTGTYVTVLDVNPRNSCI